MPFIAIDANSKERIDITQYDDPKAALDGRDFLCQDCGTEMYIRSGDFYTPHFVHTPTDEYRPCWYKSNGESELHRECKRMIAKVLREAEALKITDVEIEYPVETRAGRRYVDVYVESDYGRYAHEAQLSNQSVRQFIERTEAYRTAGLGTVWWIGESADTGENRRWIDSNCDFVGTIRVARTRRTIIDYRPDYRPGEPVRETNGARGNGAASLELARTGS